MRDAVKKMAGGINQYPIFLRYADIDRRLK
jgi:hypothetical protein